MANNGVDYSDYSHGKRLKFEFWTKSRDIQNNKTTIGYRLTGDGGSGYIVSRKARLIINNVEVLNNQNNFNLYNNTVLAQGDFEMNHDNNGHLFMFVYYEIAISNYNVNVKRNYQVQLDSIPRKAFFTECTDFTDEENPKVKIVNKANLPTEVSLQFFNQLYFTRENLQADNLTSLELSEQERETLRELLKNDNSYLFNYVIKTFTSDKSHVIGEEYIPRTIRIINADPEFAGFEFDDINPVTKNITECTNKTGEQVLYVQSQSIIKVSNVSDIVTKKQALPKFYEYNLDGITGTFPVSQKTFTFKADDLINNGEKLLTITAVDSRNNKKSITKTLNILEYKEPTASIKVTRRNNFEEESKIEASGKLSKIGKNNLEIFSYRYKEKDGEWNSWQNIEFEIDKKGSFKIKLSNGSNGIWKNFNKNKSYIIQLKYKDRISKKIFFDNFLLNEGEPFIFIDVINSQITIKGEPLAKDKVVFTFGKRATEEIGEENHILKLDTEPIFLKDFKNNSFEIIDGKIKAKRDINVLISGGAFINFRNGYLYIKIKKKHGNNTSNVAFAFNDGGDFKQATFARVPVELKKDDLLIFSLEVPYSSNSNKYVLREFPHNYITLEEV